MQPGWTSWGNQVLLFQERKHYHEVPIISDRSAVGDNQAEHEATSSSS
jgi:hypothetical protein